MQTVEINFLEKGAVDVAAAEPGWEDEPDILTRRRLMRTAVEKWLAPRAVGVRRLLLMWVVAQGGRTVWLLLVAGGSTPGACCSGWFMDESWNPSMH